MNAEELLENYEIAAAVVKSYYLEKFLESMNTTDVPENFKEFAKDKGIDDDTVAKMIEAMPRGLFDVFDGNEIYIGIIPIYKTEAIYYKYTVNTLFSGEESTRKEAEKIAVEHAFKLLNDKYDNE